MCMTSNRPYVLRALHEWITDNGMTPYILVNAEVPGVTVPTQYVQDGRVVLNVSDAAVADLYLGNDRVAFTARFAGNPVSVNLPMAAVLAIYARENGKGMIFPEDEPEESSSQEQDGADMRKPFLRVIK